MLFSSADATVETDLEEFGDCNQGFFFGGGGGGFFLFNGVRTLAAGERVCCWSSVWRSDGVSVLFGRAISAAKLGTPGCESIVEELAVARGSSYAGGGAFGC